MKNKFYLSTKRVIQNRRVYSFLDFLGDTGGLYESIFLIGNFIHLVFSFNILSVKLLENHFKETKIKSEKS